MIKINISELLGKRKMLKSDLAKKTGIRSSTISDLYYERVKTISMENLNKLCEAFDCEVSDILEYRKEEQ